jgi:hypothetical protein
MVPIQTEKKIRFTESELWTIQSTVNERYGREVPLEVAETEVRLQPEDRTLVTRPAVYWDDGQGCHFVVIKLASNTYRCQFYYRGFEQFGTGHERYYDLLQAVVTLLQVQADYELMRRQRLEQQASTAAQAAEPSAQTGEAEEDDSYKYTPIIWD